ncbi:hypothetical protein WH47_11091 [Habropoda laboriosa]|uniref:Uncharacterized protein n=1 Tax=Habropoda laboriosa TaxID=597456 RepID=A0A0L7QMA6_9HYME|nr:hypothetical protein WH47_11091 [Habropoda laboriosa]
MQTGKRTGRSYIDKNLIIKNNVHSKNEVESEAAKMTEAIQKGRDKTIKTKIVLPQGTYLSETIIELIKDRNYLRRKWQRTGRLDYKHLYKKMIGEVRNKIRTFRNEQ